jgi:hypothetical protein
VTRARNLFVNALVAAIVSIGALAVVSAANNNFGTSYKGARANLLDYGDGTFKLEACDRAKDGYGAVARLQRGPTLTTHKVKDTNGAQPHECGGSKTLELAQGERVYLWACRKDHNGNKDESRRLRCSERPTSHVIE